MKKTLTFSTVTFLLTVVVLSIACCQFQDREIPKKLSLLGVFVRATPVDSYLERVILNFNYPVVAVICDGNTSQDAFLLLEKCNHLESITLREVTVDREYLNLLKSLHVSYIEFADCQIEIPGNDFVEILSYETCILSEIDSSSRKDSLIALFKEIKGTPIEEQSHVKLIQDDGLVMVTLRRRPGS